jgi:hypothetical protein
VRTTIVCEVVPTRTSAGGLLILALAASTSCDELRLGFAFDNFIPTDLLKIAWALLFAWASST